MKALFIGGTGTISTAITRRLVDELHWDVWLLNRGNRPDAVPAGAHSIVCDINDEAAGTPTAAAHNSSVTCPARTSCPSRGSCPRR